MRNDMQHNITEVSRFYDLFRIVKIIPDEIRLQKNKEQSWEYGYNQKYDVIIISKDGTIGEIYEIYDLCIAIPEVPNQIEGSKKTTKDQKWERKALPAELKKFKSMYGDEGWNKAPKQLVDKYDPYIKEEYKRRKFGFWFMNNGIPTWIVGQHYVYLQWSPIDIGYANYWLAGMISYYHWEACRADNRSYGQVKVKCRRSGASHEASSDIIEEASISRSSSFGIVSKTGKDAKSFFIKKVVAKFRKYPFFFKPLFDGNTNPKEELAFRAPSEKVTIHNKGAHTEDDELDTYISHQTTQNNSYDSEKLKMIVEDEGGKWISKLGDILQHWDTVKECLRTGKKIIGKCKMITTVNPPKDGGESFKKLWEQSNVKDRMPNGQTKSGLYQIFVRAEHNYEGFIDQYGYPVLETPESPVMGIDGELIKQGAFQYFDELVVSLKDDPEKLNEFLRKNPRCIEDAFRQPSSGSPFVLANIHDQRERNNQMVEVIKGGRIVPRHQTQLMRFNLVWRDGKKDSFVDMIPHPEGVFYATWIPPHEQQNKQIIVNGRKTPGNADFGAFGCDPYDVSETVTDSRFSNGALIGFSRGRHMGGPEYGVFLEYAERPLSVDDFFDDVIKCCVFYGMPILPERDKARLLYEMKNRGYRSYVLNRPDKEEWELSGADKEIGGYPSRNELIRNDQIILIHGYTAKHLGEARINTYRELGTYPTMPFNRLLTDIEGFTPEKTTKSDLTMALGAAMVAVQPKSWYAKKEIEIKTINIGLKPVNQRNYEPAQ